jgi:hypothetical protein
LIPVSSYDSPSFLFRHNGRAIVTYFLLQFQIFVESRALCTSGGGLLAEFHTIDSGFHTAEAGFHLTAVDERYPAIQDPA